ncbi:MAG: GrpB family protein [SAR324 cluster bacterium]|uniref:GrpB family protein n=1 Tax=SAR324 cluster bacterium TaxID=2024889 RepID=A0A7X9FP89_9DELT|nr:GrpB family protein [SAR324 cluster bacterium]
MTKNVQLRQKYSHLKTSLAQQSFSRAEYTEQKGRWIEQVLGEVSKD